MVNKENINDINNLPKEYQSFYNYSILKSNKSTQSNNSSEFTFKKNNMNNTNYFNNFNETPEHNIYSKNDIDIRESSHFPNNKEAKFQKIIKTHKLAKKNLCEIQDNIFVQLFPKFQNYTVTRDKLIKIQKHLLKNKAKTFKKIVSTSEMKVTKKMNKNYSSNKILKNNNLIFSKINNGSLYGKYLKIVGVKSCENFKNNRNIDNLSFNNNSINRVKNIQNTHSKKILVNKKNLDDKNFKCIYRNKNINNYKDNETEYDLNSNDKIKVKLCKKKSFNNLANNNKWNCPFSLRKTNNYIF